MHLIGRISGNLAALGDDSIIYERRGWAAMEVTTVVAIISGPVDIFITEM